MSNSNGRLGWPSAAVAIAVVAAFGWVASTGLTKLPEIESVRVWSGVSLLFGAALGAAIALAASGNLGGDRAERRLERSHQRCVDALAALCVVLSAFEPTAAGKLRKDPVVQRALDG